jgi:hypothetical protein
MSRAYVLSIEPDKPFGSDDLSTAVARPVRPAPCRIDAAGGGVRPEGHTTTSGGARDAEAV